MSKNSFEPIRVFIIEHQPIVLLGLEQLIASSRHPMKVVACPKTCAEAHKLLKKKLSINVLLLDIDFDFEGSLREIPKLVQGTGARLLVLTGAHDKLLYDKLVLAGAMGIVDKESPTRTIVEAIIRIHEGQLWLDRTTTGRVFVELSTRGEKRGAGIYGNEGRSTLTKREQEIVANLAEHVEDTIREIANMLCISEHTLHNHLTSIYNKLELSNRRELFVFAQQNGLVNPAARNSS